MKNLFLFTFSAFMIFACGCSSNSEDEPITPPIQEDPQNECPANEIWYTSIDGDIVEPFNPDAFGATIKSNIYEDGKGIIRFNEDIKTIGEGAFHSTNLTSITLSESVTTIGNLAFALCASLDEINLPSKLTTIGASAFSDCSSLESITIPNSVTSVGERILFNCNNLSTIDGKYSSVDNRCLIVNGVLNSFAPAGVKEYTTPDSATKIGEYAFFACNELTNITISDKVTAIELAALWCCDNLTSATIGESVASIAMGALSSCPNLESIYLKPTTPPSLGEQALSYNSPNCKIYVPNESLEAYKSSEDWSSVGTIIFPVDGDEDGDENNLNKIYYTTTDGASLNYHKYGKVTGKVHVVSDTYENGVGVMTFSGEVKVIESTFFQANKTLKTITLPNSVTTIKYEAFYACNALESFVIPEGVTAIPAWCFSGTAIKEIVIHDNVTEIGERAFASCSSLERVTIGKGVTASNYSAFQYCDQLKRVDISDLSAWCKIWHPFAAADRSMVLPTMGGADLYLNGELLTEVTIPEDITTILDGTFFCCSFIEKVTIPESVTEIKAYSFNGCTNLKEIYIHSIVPPTAHAQKWTNGMGQTTYYWYPFESVPEDAKIYVPQESVEAYKSARHWNRYAEIIVGYDY